MAGKVTRRKDGRWVATLQVGKQRKYVYGATEREARKKLAELERKLGASQALPTPGRKTVNDLLDMWLETAEFRPVTRENHERILNNHVRPVIGHLYLSRLRPIHIQALYNALRDQGHKRVPSMVHSLLHRAFKLGVLWGFLVENPTERVIPPTHQAEQKDIWTREQLQLFLEATNHHEYSPLWVVAITTGLRLAELSGLQWRDFDPDRGVLNVRRTLHWVNSQWVEGKPKTKSSMRVISLPTLAIDALERQRQQQDEWRKKALTWQGDWIFTNQRGDPLSRSTIQHALSRVCDQLNLPRTSMHGFRHLHASLLLAGNIPVPAVSSRLGHSSPAITMSIYAHALNHQDPEAAEALDRVLSDSGEEA